MGIRQFCYAFNEGFLGLVRLLLFLLLFVRLLTVAERLPFWPSDVDTVMRLLAIWGYIALVIQVTACVLLMADCVVTTKKPLGKCVDEFTFLHMSGIPPMLARACLYMIISGINTSSWWQRAMPAQIVSVTSTVNVTDITGQHFTELVSEASSFLTLCLSLILLCVSLSRDWKQLFDESVPSTTKIIRLKDCGNHWNHFRYYEAPTYQAPTQSHKQRLEKVVLLFGLLYGMTIQLWTCSQMFLTPNGIPIWRTLSVAVGNFGSVLLSVCLTVNVLKLTVRTKFRPVHTVAKLAYVYTVISASPSFSIIQVPGLDAREVSIAVLVMTYILVILPLLPYCFTHSIWTVKSHMTGYMESIGEFFRNFTHPSKVYRFAHTLTVSLATCGLVLLMVGVTYPWCTVHFRPGTEMTSLINITDSLKSGVGEVITTISTIVDATTICGSHGDRSYITDMQYKDLRRNITKCNAKPFTDPKQCQNLSATLDHFENGNTSYVDLAAGSHEACENAECTIYLTTFSAGVALAQIPYGGSAGTLVMQIARVYRKITTVTNKLRRQSKHLKSASKALYNLGQVVKNPLVSLAVVYSYNLTILVVPAAIFGIICLSVGFWRRKSLEGSINRGIAFVFLMLVTTSNLGLAGAFWFIIPFLQKFTGVVPFMEIEIEEGTGLRLMKIAYTLTSIGAGMITLAMFGSSMCGCKRRQMYDLTVPSQLEAMHPDMIRVCNIKTLGNSRCNSIASSLDSIGSTVATLDKRHRRKEGKQKDTMESLANSRCNSVGSSRHSLDSVDISTTNREKRNKRKDPKQDNFPAKSDHIKSLANSRCNSVVSSCHSLDSVDISNREKRNRRKDPKQGNSPAKSDHIKSLANSRCNSVASSRHSLDSVDISTTNREKRNRRKDPKQENSPAKNDGIKTFGIGHSQCSSVWSGPEILDMFSESPRAIEPIAWMMSCIPSIAAASVIAYIFISGSVPFSMHRKANGELRAQISTVSEATDRGLAGIEEMNDQSAYCDVVGPAILVPFKILENILLSPVEDFTRIKQLILTFLLDDIVVMHYLVSVYFLIAPMIALVLLLIGLIISVVAGDAGLVHQPRILRALFWLPCFGIGLCFTTLDFMATALNSVPLFDLRLEVGANLNLIILVHILVIVSWLQIKLHQYVPITAIRSV